ncbi:hypothetical protein BJ508DRAFT_316074 [Ascobolus immersus RN42]|uniref:Uncharacterized protein n=1 Tax=Ascobolus immersus RN42 TaxID=1160509 RepID=A0A3N4H7W7_ASCIM|nr:hypothetical protein BJ508DRAFT_316074 [Ascobolus immersus RN42]
MANNAKRNLLKSLSEEDTKWLLQKARANTLPTRVTDSGFAVLKQRLQKTDDDVLAIASIIRKVIAKKPQPANSLHHQNRSSVPRTPPRSSSGPPEDQALNSQNLHRRTTSSSTVSSPQRTSTSQHQPISAITPTNARSSVSSKLDRTAKQQQPSERRKPPVWQHPSFSGDADSTDKVSDRSSHVNAPQMSSMNPPDLPYAQLSTPHQQSHSRVAKHPDDEPPSDPLPANAGTAQPASLEHRKHETRRNSTPSTGLLETGRSTAPIDDPSPAFQPSIPLVSGNIHRHSSTPTSVHESYSSPMKRRREDTCDSGFGSSVPDHAEHGKGVSGASYASSMAGSISESGGEAVPHYPPYVMDRLQTSSHIVQGHWDELISVRHNLNLAMVEVELGKLQIVKLHEKVAGLTEILTSVQSEKSTALRTVDELTAANVALKTTNENLVKENERLKEDIQVINHPLPVE